jgi:uncharacterized protein
MELVALALYMLAPFLLLRLHRSLGALAAVLGLWLPLEFRLLQGLGINPVTAIASGMIAGVLAFRSRPDILDVAAAFNLRKMAFRNAFLNFALFAAVGIPLALAIGFIQFAARLPDVRSIPALVATILLFNALPEEILFRGILQNMLESVLKSRTAALLVGALIFGISHLNNGASVPNTRYFIVATLAGVFYGNTWRRNRNVLDSAITHTLVNVGWRVLF